jgi:serine protease
MLLSSMRSLTAVLACSTGLALTVGAAEAGPLHFGSPLQQLQSSPGPQSLGNGWLKDQGVIYHAPHYMPTIQQQAQMRKAPAVSGLDYHGGWAFQTPHMYIIFWGYKPGNDTDHVKALLTNYGKNVGGSALFNVVTQYTGPGNVPIGNGPNQLIATWTDTQDAIPTSPSDAQVAAEAVKGMSVFGAFDPNGSYVVATAKGHDSPGFGTSFCAYHGTVVSGANTLSYTNLPYIPDAGANCGAGFISPPSDETSADEGVTIVAGHEYAESATDPDLNAWWDSSNGEEIGDLCAWTDVQNDPFGKKRYASQPLWSNASSSCVHSFN